MSSSTKGELKVQLIPLEQVEPNDWNPNVMSERTYQAERESILAYGFIDPITVRPHPETPDHYQIVDGEHRWRVLRSLMAEGLPAGAHPSIEELVRQRSVPAIVRELDDVSAKKLTVILNETRGRAQEQKLGELMRELSLEVDLGELMRGLPFDTAELDSLIQMGQLEAGDLSLPEVDLTPSEPKNPQTDDEWVRFRVAISAQAFEVYQQALERVRQVSDLHPDPAIAHGQVLEALAADFLASVGAAES